MKIFGAVFGTISCIFSLMILSCLGDVHRNHGSLIVVAAAFFVFGALLLHSSTK
jgi:hypothetical protein